jgi:phosphotransferase system HPr (HPr) family protein
MRQRVRIPDALHARPANLLVRATCRMKAEVFLHHGCKRVNARNILEVLSLGAPKGADIEIEASGEQAQDAIDAVLRLIERNFDQDLVPEWGSVAVEGIAIGRAVRLEARREGGSVAGSLDDERRELDAAFAQVTEDVQRLLSSLPPAEGKLFEPELEILRDLRPLLDGLLERGESAEGAVRAATEERPTDLLLDVRVRLIGALRGEEHALLAHLDGVQGDLVVVTEELTPSLVARLPKRVVGVIAVLDEADGGSGVFTSHAALLARGRGLPLVLAPSHVALAIGDEIVVIDTTEEPARIWSSPGEDLLAQIRARRAARDVAELEAEGRASSPLIHLGVSVRANVGSVDDEVPKGAEGIGLVRTELVFAAETAAPSEAQQLSALIAIGARGRGGPVVVRLFDAGGDKACAWIPPPSFDLGARGVALLLHHRGVLQTQLRAMAMAAQSFDLWVLVPLVRDGSDLEAVRREAPNGLRIGAMVESVEAVERIDEIVAQSEFLSLGTNDLTASVLGTSRERRSVAKDGRVFRLIAKTIERGHHAGKKVTVCGELASDPDGARILVGLGADALSVAPPRVSALKLALASTSIDDCRALAKAACAK